MSEEKKQKVEITVDNKATEKLVEILEKERQEKEAKESEDDLATKKLQAYQKFHNPMFLDAPDKETLNAMLTNYINELAEKSQRNPNPSGTAPLNSAQYGTKEENLYEKKYSSHYEMVSDLINKSHNGNEEAQSYLNSLMKKYILDKRQNPQRIEGFHNPNSPEALQELDLVRKGDVLMPRDPKDGDIGRILNSWKLERMRRMKGEKE
jgi:hypothetical protein